MCALRMRVLLLDNRDSFVWNLAQALQVLGAEVDVQRSDSVAVDAVGETDALVLSPGPGRPEDAGVCVAAVQRWGASLPILGVCLGHQAIAVAHGASIERCPPCHGRATSVEHDGGGIFRDLDSPLPWARYHSLAVDPETVPDCLDVIARCEGLVMALAHRDHPTWGVQFHPESFLSAQGPRLLANFLELAA